MAEIAEVPMPTVLDPDRMHSDDRDDMTVLEHRSRAQQLDDALHETCEYAQQLWRTLQAARQYLMDSIPSDPSTGEFNRASAAPTGIDDQEGWRHWIDVYATVTSALAGPHGDSGLGRNEASEAARRRRARPVLLPSQELAHLPAREGEGQRIAEAFVRANAERLGDPPPVPDGGPQEQEQRETTKRQRRLTAVRVAAEVAVCLLALRGLRTRALRLP